MAAAIQPVQPPGISVVVCGPSLINAYQPLHSDCDHTFCFSTDFSSGLQAAETFAPSVLLVEDAELSAGDIAAVRIRLALGHPVRILVAMTSASVERRRELLRHGIAGFIEHTDTPAIVRKAINHVADGEIWASRKILSDVLRGIVSVNDDLKFTRREMDILRRIAAGEDNRQIAERLYITRETVRWHLRSAYAKLGVHDRKVAADVMRSTG